MGISDPRLCFDCKRFLKNWVEFQLVDEQGKPLVNMPYRLISRGTPDYVSQGVTNIEYYRLLSGYLPCFRNG
ncbi:hypothetical protein OO184_03200 [Photorhabdus sp. APURE]|uniref:hypothetical protein n=1 Tax=Photorhabdus aballayi TaxID=2991723 RepID=UPI00223E1425|nr:hypothetical protein [Photorhabdus aballayi]MCW7546978.1 hypothetical protein [Photorhabdus aballayi]